MTDRLAGTELEEVDRLLGEIVASHDGCLDCGQWPLKDHDGPRFTDDAPVVAHPWLPTEKGQ